MTPGEGHSSQRGRRDTRAETAGRPTVPMGGEECVPGDRMETEADRRWGCWSPLSPRPRSTLGELLGWGDGEGQGSRDCGALTELTGETRTQPGALAHAPGCSGPSRGPRGQLGCGCGVRWSSHRRSGGRVSKACTVGRGQGTRDTARPDSTAPGQRPAHGGSPEAIHQPRGPSRGDWLPVLLCTHYRLTSPARARNSLWTPGCD